MPNAGCPPLDELTAFASGHLPAAAMDVLAKHVLDCQKCQAQLAVINPTCGLIFAALRPEHARPVDASALTRFPAEPPAGTAIQNSGNTALYISSTPIQPAHPNPRQPLALGSVPRQESEIRDLLQFRLRALAVVGLVVFVFFLVQRLAEPLRHSVAPRAWDWRDQGTIVLALLAYIATVTILWLRPVLPLSRLRAVELIIVAAVATSLAGTRYVTLANAGVGSEESAGYSELHIEYTVLLSNMAWYFCIAMYGLFIPNTLRRCVVIVGCLSTIPLVITLMAAEANPAIAAKLPMLLGVTTIGVFLTAALAAFGSFKIESLEREVFAVREEARELGQYQLTRKLGGGGMGDVYLAEHRLLKRACAVKLIRPERASDPGYLRRFEREVQAMAQLRHPNTVEVYDYGHADDGTFYYVMEYLPGLTLDQVVKRSGPLPPARVIHLLRQLCAALRASHGIGLIHRDIKPSNVMLCQDPTLYDQVKLLDFGLVRPVGTNVVLSELTSEGMVVGTPEYMSPEQVEGTVEIDGRSDLYSLGALAYYLLTGRPPFSGESVMEVLMAHLRSPVPLLNESCPGVPADLEAIIYRCLAKKATERFSDAASVEAALANCDCSGQWLEEEAVAWWRTATESASIN